MKYKRRKPRQKVRCVLCTDNRDGNTDKRPATIRIIAEEREQLRGADSWRTGRPWTERP